MNSGKLFSLILFFIVFETSAQKPAAVNIFFDSNSGQTQFAVNELQQSLQTKGLKFSIYPIEKNTKFKNNNYNIILLSLSNEATSAILKNSGISNSGELTDEGYLIYKSSGSDKTIYILGKNDAGVMYGGLEVAEIVKLGGIDKIENQLQNPYMKVRGTKFNIPLDARTPSYTDVSDAAQQNIAEMWSFEFWKDYIDNLARFRYNTISIWSLHPFPSMVKVPEYPNVALNDVHRSTTKWNENYSLNAWNFDAPEILNNYEVLKKISIEEKIEFWRKVMAYGKQRNVQFFVVTWNIFTNGTFGKYGITDRIENPVTTDYFRKSVKQMLLTYPDLAGIGLTTGENMYDYTAQQKEEWAFSTYGKGILDALQEQPNRKITLIHRQHQTQAKEITTIFQDIVDNPNVNFVFSFKYAQAHVYSSINQTFHQKFVEDIKSANLKTLWTLRNDDIFHFRWGAPDYVRDFIKNIPYDVSEGFYYGSDQWIWGREFLGKDTTAPREIEIAKHWYQFMCWGRLGYNPNMGNNRFIDVIKYKFPEVEAQAMFDAWQNASMIYPFVTGFHWGSLDFQWYIESGQSQPFVAETPSGFHDVNRFISLPPHKGTGYISIPEYTKAFIDSTEMKGETPLEVAGKIIANSDKALNWANSQSTTLNAELRITLDDIKTIACLGNYYGHKILGATYLSLFRESLKKEWLEKSIDELNSSAAYWRQFASIAMSNYKNPLWTNRVGIVDWKENFSLSLYDITSNGGKLNLPSMKPTAGGIILEAEDAEFPFSKVESKITGFSGTGYLLTNVGDKKNRITWTYDAPVAGKYNLEIRYTSNRQQVFESPVIVNGIKANTIEFWQTGNAGTWVWDRVSVNLVKGKNTIQILPEGFILVDNLNILK